MRINRRAIAAIICALALLGSVVGAQEKRPAQTFVFSSGGGGQVVTGGAGGSVAWASQGDNTFVYLSTEMSLKDKLVKGAPYSAQAVTEQVQVLADGNRIVRRDTASVYRDSEGRTRREQSIKAIGPYAASGEPQEMIFINDPVAEVNYILDSKNRTARKMDLSGMAVARKKAVESARARTVEGKGTSGSDQQKIEERKQVEIARAGGIGMRGPGPGPVFESSIGFAKEFRKDQMKEESLGKQIIEGVEAEGTRTTLTIPAGDIGNEAPIYIVEERWFSPELQVLVMSKHSDPRMGENTYRLTNINRSEPAHSLFELPSDYTIKETIAPGMRTKIESELRRPGEKQSQ
ncbi:MAG TPA: hypothetical protein VLM38_16640 [Blastocatellia bacterium]|nr:hypothetical protein [Blastocatellia bacterium]